MEYITELIGVSVSRARWELQDKLPYFLNEKYRFEQAEIGDAACLFVRPTGELDTINTVKKHIKRIIESDPRTVVLELSSLSRQRRNSFIEARIPFVVPGKQLYLPFIGVQLSERCDSDRLSPTSEKLQPSAQMLLFAFLLGNNERMRLTPIAEQFGFSAMTITRAANQLVELDLVKKESCGVQKFLTATLAPRELYERAKPCLISPVRKTVYIDREAVLPNMFHSGLSALSDMSMLNPPTIETWAIVKPNNRLLNPVRQLIDSEKQCALQVWKYDPRKVSRSDATDPLSLIASFGEDVDERIEQSLDEVLKGLW